MYGVAENTLVNESASFDPQSAYAKAKVFSERDLLLLSDDSFSPVFLRNSTVFGVSPRMRLDLIVQNLAAYGYLNGVITILSDGKPWRPQVHVQDVAEAFAFFLTLPRDVISGQAYNIGKDENNLQIKDIANLVQSSLSGASIEIKNQNPSDTRSYKVDFSKLASLGFVPKWSVADGIEEILGTFKRVGFSHDHFSSDNFITIKRYQKLVSERKLDSNLRLI
jgi:nucleoside-diphosphate-sugar epimerase